MPLRALLGYVLLVGAAGIGIFGMGWRPHGAYGPMEPILFAPALALGIPALLLLATADGERRHPVALMIVVALPIALFAVLGLIGGGLSVLLADWRPPPLEWQIAAIVIVPVVTGILALIVKERE